LFNRTTRLLTTTVPFGSPYLDFSCLPHFDILPNQPAQSLAIMAAQNPAPFKILGQKAANIAYVERSAVRAIVYNPANSEMALIHIRKGDHYKLPGGGVKGGEDYELAVAREVLEETGCRVVLDNASGFAKTEEWRNDMHQISHCYVAKLAGNTGKPELTVLEREEGLTHMWLTVADAIRTMKESQPTSQLGNFIKERDMFFVETFASSLR
jgi:8-oxo-dGTP diphosphatase